MLIPSAYAQAAGAAAPAGGGLAATVMSFAPLLLVFVAFWFLMIRPQQQRQRALQTSVAAVKKGDEVVTAGGHIGRVTKVSDHEVEVDFGGGQKHRVVKMTLAEVRTAGAKPAND